MQLLKMHGVGRVNIDLVDLEFWRDSYVIVIAWLPVSLILQTYFTSL